MRRLAEPLATLGRASLAVARDTGGMALLAGQTVVALFPPRIEMPEFVRALRRFGVASLPLVAATAFLTGIIAALQSVDYVERWGADTLVGWGAGFTIVREIGPILIALMVSGRVGSRNTAELATMTITEQVDALRVLAVDPYAYLVVPRTFALIVLTFCLTIIGDLIALVGAALTSKVLMGLSLRMFYNSLVNGVSVGDLMHGLVKSGFFGGLIALTSCHFGLSATGGAASVGRAVNRAVVASAVLIFALDFVLSWVLG